MLIVDLTNIVERGRGAPSISRSSVNGQPRGVLQRIETVTTGCGWGRGPVTFDEVPAVGKNLSGNFHATLSDPSGYTLNGSFSATVTAP